MSRKKRVDKHLLANKVIVKVLKMLLPLMIGMRVVLVVKLPMLQLAGTIVVIRRKAEVVAIAVEDLLVYTVEEDGEDAKGMKTNVTSKKGVDLIFEIEIAVVDLVVILHVVGVGEGEGVVEPVVDILREATEVITHTTNLLRRGIIPTLGIIVLQ